MDGEPFFNCFRGFQQLYKGSEMGDENGKFIQKWWKQKPYWRWEMAASSSEQFQRLRKRVDD
jgi:hypothetical protein